MFVVLRLRDFLFNFEALLVNNNVINQLIKLILQTIIMCSIHISCIKHVHFVALRHARVHARRLAEAELRGQLGRAKAADVGRAPGAPTNK